MNTHTQPIFTIKGKAGMLVAATALAGMCALLGGSRASAAGTLADGSPCTSSAVCQSGSCVANANSVFVCTSSGSATTPTTKPAGDYNADYDQVQGVKPVANPTAGNTTVPAMPTTPMVVPSPTASTAAPVSSYAGATGTATAQAGCAGKVEAGVCFPSNTGLPDPSGGIKGIAENVLNWLLGIFTTIAIIAFVISGIQYLTAAGDEDQLTVAKRNAKWSLIGVLVGLSGFVILQAVNSALTASSTAF